MPEVKHRPYVPADSNMKEFTVRALDEELLHTVRAILDYGKDRGMGQWRTSGKGRFTWEELPEQK